MGLTVQDILKAMIKSIDIFKDISDEECLDLATNFTLQYYPQGSVVIKEGQKPSSIYILKNGKLQARKSNGLTMITLGDILPGQLVGEMSYLKNTTAMASVIATADSDVWELPVEDFDKFLKKYPYIMEKAMDILNEREAQNNSKFRFSSDSNVEQDSLSDFKIVL